MNGMDKRLKRLEGPQIPFGETPEWCGKRASVEAHLGFIDPDEIEMRTRAIAEQFRSEKGYLEEQERIFMDFINLTEGTR